MTTIRESEKIKGMDKFLYQNTKIGDDIYAYAFASLIDANKIRAGLIEKFLNKDEKNKILPVIEYNSRETSNIFLGALLVIMFQMTMMFLIINFMTSPENNF